LKKAMPSEQKQAPQGGEAGQNKIRRVDHLGGDLVNEKKRASEAEWMNIS